MSDQPPITPPPPPPPPEPPRQRRHPIVSIIMVICGLVLLLPGVCAIAFSGAVAEAPVLVLLWLICIGISVGGLFLIVKAFR